MENVEKSFSKNYINCLKLISILKSDLSSFTENKAEQKFIIDNIINSPEWWGYALIDTGYIKKEDAIEIVKDRTNHTNDKYEITDDIMKMRYTNMTNNPKLLEVISNSFNMDVVNLKDKK